MFQITNQQRIPFLRLRLPLMKNRLNLGRLNIKMLDTQKKKSIFPLLSCLKSGCSRVIAHGICLRNPKELGNGSCMIISAQQKKCPMNFDPFPYDQLENSWNGLTWYTAKYLILVTENVVRREVIMIHPVSCQWIYWWFTDWLVNNGISHIFPNLLDIWIVY